MSAQFTYSFLDTHAAISGPGAGFSLGSGAGVADEGISIEPFEEIDMMTIGADGTPMHSLRADKSGKITVRLLKTSPVNQQLMAAQTLQRQSASSHGQNQFSITNTASGDMWACEQVAFARVPNVNYAKDGDILVWEFNAGIINPALGAGV